MKKNRTIKRDFYLLVIKIVTLSLISTFIMYLCLIIFIFVSTDNENAKTSDYYVKYIDLIEKKIKENSTSILNGELIELEYFDKNIKGEVLDIQGNHLYGNIDISDNKIDFEKSINHEIVKNNNIYRYVCIKDDNLIKAIYLLRAPFGFSINNIKGNPEMVFIYILLILSPLIFFILYLIIFTSNLYKFIYNNIKILVLGADNVIKGNFEFKVEGLKGMEFLKIQDSFNTMIITLKNTLVKLSTLDKEKSIMVSAIGHDIKTPLTVIKIQVELIKELKDNCEFNLNSHLDIVDRNCMRMSILLDNLSLVDKVDKEFFFLRIQNIELHKILEEKKIEIESTSYKKDIHIKFDVNLSKKIYNLDESMLLRVLDNILYNSLRFTTEGEIKLVVYDEEISNKIHFECIDTGIGFKQKSIPEIFEAFYRDEDDINHFGLGLYICKKIVTNYCGDISAYNNENNGATIKFHIIELND